MERQAAPEPARIVPRDPRRAKRTLLRIGLRRRPLGDLYHILLTISWGRLVGLMALGYVAINALFASLYLLDVDGIENARPGSFADAFFFSVQTMATIGYGRMTPIGPFANTLVAAEALLSMLGVTTATGLLFAKFSRPTARVMFSEKAVVASWEGQPALMIRMANVRQNQVVEANLRLVLARDEEGPDGRMRRFHDLKLVRSSNVIFAFTWTAIHVIDGASALHGVDEAGLQRVGGELIASLTGLDETFGQMVHARWSWLPSEVVWSHKFADILKTLPDGQRAIDYNHFHKVVPLRPPPAAEPENR